MKWLYWTLALVAVAFVCFFLRYRAHPACRVPDGLSLTGGTSWQIDDFDGAYHARRVQVALATGQVPAYDTFINAPTGSPVPWPTFFDGLLTAVVEILVDPSPDGSPEMGGYNEGDVDAILVHVPPVLGVLALLGCVMAVFAAASRDRAPPSDVHGSDAGARVSNLWRWAPWWALAAGAVYACQPTAVMYAQIGRLDHHVATAMFLALQLALCLRALVAREPIEVALLAAGVGLAGALGVLTWMAHGVVLGVCGIGFAHRALSRDRVESDRGWQGGAICFAIATLVTLFPAWSSPWNEVQPGSLINLSMGVPRALGAAAIPFIVFGLAGRRTLRRDLRTLYGALALVAAVLLLPGFVSQVLEGVRWADRTNEFMFIIDESQPMRGKQVFGVGGYTGHLGHAWMALPVAALVLLLRPRPERVVLLLTLILFAFFAYQQRRFANSLAVPMAIAIGVGGLEIARMWNRFASKRATWIPHALLLLALAPTVAFAARITLRPTPQEFLGNAVRWNHILGGLRWMRDNTPSPGAWNEPTLEPEYAVLASWSDGHLIEFHARRPTISTNFGSFVGVDNFRAAPRTLLESDPVRFSELLTEMDVRYVVLRPRVLSWFREEAMISSRSDEDRELRPLVGPDGLTEWALNSAYFQLTLHRLRIGDVHPRFTSLRLAWRSPLVIDVMGAMPSDAPPTLGYGPSLSIWEYIGG